MSSTEPEYIVVSEAAKTTYWMKKFIEELGVVPSTENPVKVYCDNLEVIKVHTDDNVVDPLTKALPCDKLKFHTNGI
nr:hypothetical protein [Tanacetum cinerariifolium]